VCCIWVILYIRCYYIWLIIFLLLTILNSGINEYKSPHLNNNNKDIYNAQIRRGSKCADVLYLLKHIKRIESVQKCFTKWLPILSYLNYANRLKLLGLVSLELIRLNQHLLYTYKSLFGKLKVDYVDMFVVRSQSVTRGHQW